ncbi:hypothetical protein [Kitasatospora sp. NPDC093806]|uniref:helix-turn-helix domain-containing protein n=1 Tax=Kitasatospora sp. NPDC093806 TaxID=3155075 RepID=UPI0034377FE6
MAHPLTRLRTAQGLSHADYARLVARTHAELGLGQMAARREKVSRWESGRTVPEHTAQLAMARIHGVPADEVRRLGWPHWLHLVLSDAVLLDQAYTDRGAELALHGTLHLRKGPSTPALLLRGAALAAQTRSALALITAPDRRPDAEGRSPSAEQLQWCEARIAALERHEAGTAVPAATLYRAARAEHRLVVRLLGVGGADAPTSRRLFALAARTALLCTWLSSALGEEARAERYNLAAVRAAAAAAEPALATAAFTQLALRHVIAGDPADALALVRAAGDAGSGPLPATAVPVRLVEALAFARQGCATDAARALDRAAVTAAPGPHPHPHPHPAPAPDDPSGTAALARAVTVARAQAALFLGAPREARSYFETLTDSLLAPRAIDPSPHTGVWLLYATDVHLELGEVDLAARAVHRAVNAIGLLPSGLARQYRQRLAHHAREPAVRRALVHLTDLPKTSGTSCNSGCPGVH